MRTSGFETPLSRDQVTSWVIQLTLIGSFIIFVSTLLSRDKCLAILLPNAVLVIIVLTAWCICERRDPSKPKPSSSCFPSLLRVPRKESRYCGLCFKNSPGLDHHCTWLNTCIAESNYEAFYCLAVSATCQTLLQTVVGILMCTLWQSEVRANAVDDWDKAVIVLLWIHNVACISLTNSFVLLAGFHTYLLCIGMGTYDFILANGSEGLCTRMLKCNCLRRKKQKRSHVQHADTSAAKNSMDVSARASKGPPSAAIFPANLSISSPPQTQPSPEQVAAAEASKYSDANRYSASAISHLVEVSEVTGTPPNRVLSARIDESEGIFDNIDLSSPS